MPLNEADTCRVYVTPALQNAGWGEAQLCGIPVRLPGHAGQELLQKLMRHVRASRALHAQIQSELESVMPSALHEAFGGELVEANT